MRRALMVGVVLLAAIASLILVLCFMAESSATTKRESLQVGLPEEPPAALRPLPALAHSSSTAGIPARLESGASHQEPAVAPLEAIAWDDVPLDGMGGFHTFEPDEFRIVQERMLDLFVKRFRSCGTAAKPPQTWESSFELRLAPVEGGYVIRDAILRRANYGLAELEACFREAYVGQTITVDVTTGPIRIEEPVRFVVPMMPNRR